MFKEVLKGIIAIVVVALLVGYGISKSVNNSNISLKTSSSIYAEASIFPITNLLEAFESNRCVCKNGVCSKGNFLSFRKRCGRGDSDANCAPQGSISSGEVILVNICAEEKIKCHILK